VHYEYKIIPYDLQYVDTNREKTEIQDEMTALSKAGFEFFNTVVVPNGNVLGTVVMYFRRAIEEN
jgi:hypothetical protein